MKVAILGANGQLGADVTSAFLAEGDEVVGLTHEDVEVSSLESVKKSLEAIRPQVVINTAAFHNVERCEGEPLPAFTVNAMGARNVAQVTDSLRAKLLHISTDYVFDGEKSSPYVEEDSPRPLNAYGNSKLAGEYFVRCTNPRHFVVRVSGIYGMHPCRAKAGLNFVEMMLKLAGEREELRVVDDQRVTPTPTVEIAQQLTLLAKTDDYGIYHATSESSCTWYEFARAIFDLTGTKVRVEKARPGDFPAKAHRPQNSVLENAALKARSLNVFTHWRTGLATYLSHRKPPFQE
ncbi:MAG TPA: dTDP-4-dehydrorhamnose reductase [Candidatus Angelobacter sp.]|jgi:dTDP-4-dehydrorhamnose reductase|nr:dTDP-4-dehydrorhamnose reductase [Candidatus Angelobacter sp.]